MLNVAAVAKQQACEKSVHENSYWINFK